MSDRLTAFTAALAGLLGVAGSAMAAHGAGGSALDTAARFLLVHAAALLALAAALRAGVVAAWGRWAAALLVLGLGFFCGDLSLRALAGQGLFPMAAPAGGFALMAGWLLVGAAAMAGRRSGP